MIKKLSCKFHKCLVPFNMLTVKGCYETALFQVSVTKSFTVCNFNKLATIIAFELGTPNSHNTKQYACHWQSRCYDKTPKVSHITKGDIFQMTFPQSDEKM